MWKLLDELNFIRPQCFYLLHRVLCKPHMRSTFCRVPRGVMVLPSGNVLAGRAWPRSLNGEFRTIESFFTIYSLFYKHRSITSEWFFYVLTAFCNVRWNYEDVIWIWNIITMAVLYLGITLFYDQDNESETEELE